MYSNIVELLNNVMVTIDDINILQTDATIIAVLPLSMEEIKAQHETNLFGVIRVTQMPSI
jgi:hypothetical protein